MPLRNTLDKVIKLIDEISNIDTAHRERLREGHCSGEPLTADGNQQRVRMKGFDIRG